MITHTRKGTYTGRLYLRASRLILKAAFCYRAAWMIERNKEQNKLLIILGIDAPLFPENDMPLFDQ